MTKGSQGSILRSIRALWNAGSVGGMSDGQLLDQFLARRDEGAEAAFAALVALHGPMVWDVCRSVLSDPHAAEDAFQATFLILVRKAGSIRRCDAVGPWLYGVARRVAVRAKSDVARRRSFEGQGTEMRATPTPPPDPTRREQIEALHQEVDRLPEKYRAPVVLCHLEGRTHAEAARLLKCPAGTVSVRLSRARELLRARLTRRGLVPHTAWAGGTLPSRALSAAMPTGLAESTIQVAMHAAAGKAMAAGSVPAVAAQLAEGEIRAMTFTKVAVAAAGVLAAGFVTAGAGWLAASGRSAQVNSGAAPTAQDSREVRDAPAKGINDHGAQLTAIREGAASSARSIRSMEFAFRQESDDGWQANVQFYGEGDRFRVNRQDIVGSKFQGQRLAPLSLTSAFNGERQQMFFGDQSRLRLKDGNGGAKYGVVTPQTIVYSWLRAPGGDLRWDVIREPLSWTQRFAEATYVGATVEDREPLAIVEFPQRQGVRTPCIFRVYFAPRLGYLPLKYDRFVEASKELTSWMRVERYNVWEIEGNRVAVPLEVKFGQNDKDRAGLPMTLTFTVAEDTLKVNHDIDDGVFTIARAIAKDVFDQDEFPISPAPVATGGPRSADTILGEYDAVQEPKSDGDRRRDGARPRKDVHEWSQAQQRKAQLARELLLAHPDHERLPELLLARWRTLKTIGAAGDRPPVEIERSLPRFKDPKQIREASFFKAWYTISRHGDEPARALPVVDEFIRDDPKDPRGAELLDQIARRSGDPRMKVKVLRRLLADYPGAPGSSRARGAVRLLEGVGKPFELAFTDAINGAPVSVQALKGKVVIIDFWATWCEPCVADLPKMKELYAKYRDRGVEFLGVSLDLPQEQGGLDKLKAFVAGNGITWPQYYQGKGWESEFSRSWGIDSIPHLLLVDAEGNLAVTDAHVGALVSVPGARGELEERIIEYLAKAKEAASQK